MLVKTVAGNSVAERLTSIMPLVVSNKPRINPNGVLVVMLEGKILLSISLNITNNAIIAPTDKTDSMQFSNVSKTFCCLSDCGRAAMASMVLYFIIISVV